MTWGFATFALLGVLALAGPLHGDVTRAQQLMEKGLYTEAARELENQLQVNPQDVEALKLLARVYIRLEKYPEAVGVAKKALELAPQDAEARQIYEEAKVRRDEGLGFLVKEYERVLRAHPEDLTYRLKAARAYYQLEQWDKAAEHYQAYLKVRPEDHQVRHEYAQVLAWSNRFDEASREYQKLLEVYPDSLSLRLEYAYTLLWAGKYDPAIAQFQKVLEADPQNTKAQKGLAQAKELKKATAPRLSLIDVYYARLEKNPEDQSTRLKLVRQLIKAKRYEEAIIEAQKVLKARPQDPTATQLLREAQARLNDLLQDSLRIYRQRLAEHPDDPKLHYHMARILTRLERYQEALPHYEAYLKARPEDTHTRLLYARVLSWAGDFRKAVRAYEEVLSLWPDSLGVLEEYAENLSWAGKYEDATRVYEKLLAHAPERLDLQLAYGKNLVWAGAYEAAVPVLRQVVEKQPGNPEAHLFLAYSLFQTGKLGEAEKEYEAVLKLDPLNAEAKERLEEVRKEKQRKPIYEARKLSKRRQYSSAIALYQQYLEKFPNDTAIWLEYARVLTWAGQYPEAEEVYRRLIPLMPESLNLKIELARVYAWQEKFDQAQALYAEVLEADPQNADALVGLGQIALWEGKRDLARRYFEKALAIKPTHPAARKGLAETRDHPTVRNLVGRVRDNEGITWTRWDFGGSLFPVQGLETRVTYQRFTYEQVVTQTPTQTVKDWIRANGLKLELIRDVSENLTVQGWYRGMAYSSWGQIPGENHYSLSVSYHAPGQPRVKGSYTHYNAVFEVYKLEAIRDTIRADRIELDLSHTFREQYIAEAEYAISVYTDGNRREELYLRLGYLMTPTFRFGYEYNSLRFSQTTWKYWSPDLYDHHAAWVDYTNRLTEDFSFRFQGKLALVPIFNAFERNLSLGLFYTPTKSLFLEGIITFQETQRSATQPYSYTAFTFGASLSL